MITLEVVLAAAMRHKEVVDTLGEALSSDLVVANPHYRLFAKFLVDFTREHDTLPRNGDIEVWTSTLPDTQRTSVLDAIGRVVIQDTNAYTPQFLAQHSIAELKTVAARTAVSRLASTAAPTPELLYELAEQVKRIEPVTIDGLADIRDVERWVMTDDQAEYITTGIRKLDEYIGGFQKQELVIEFADSGIGKTTLLCNHSHAAATQGANVLQVTLELSQARTMHRLYRRIAEADRVYFRTQQQDVITRSKHWVQYAKGNIHVLEQRAYELDPEILRVLVDRYAQRFGRLDMLVLDYIDLLAPSKDLRGKSTADQLAQMSHRIRAIGLDYNAVILTASQAVRRANGAERLTMADMGDSYGKVRAAGILMGLVQTEQEEQVHQARLCLLKLRDSAGRGMEVPLYLNHDIMRISDLDHPDTLRVMRQLGHLPVAAAVGPAVAPPKVSIR